MGAILDIMRDESQELLLLDLPNPLLLCILQWLDPQSLCYVSRACTLLSKIAAHPSLWPHFKDDGCAVWDVRCTLARILRLPPQVGPCSSVCLCIPDTCHTTFVASRKYSVDLYCVVWSGSVFLAPLCECFREVTASSTAVTAHASPADHGMHLC